MKEYIQRVKIDLKLDNLNDIIKHSRANGKYANRCKQKEMELVSYYINKLKPIKSYPITLNCEWHIKTITSDLDNKVLKSVLDQMQKSGIIENDNIKHINEINNKAVKDSRDYLILEIIERE
jgi:Holliday junction resolvase RusA-like endonuclease